MGRTSLKRSLALPVIRVASQIGMVAAPERQELLSHSLYSRPFRDNLSGKSSSWGEVRRRQRRSLPRYYVGLYVFRHANQNP